MLLGDAFDAYESDGDCARSAPVDLVDRHAIDEIRDAFSNGVFWCHHFFASNRAISA